MIWLVPGQLSHAQSKNLMKAENVLANWTQKTGGDAWKAVRNRVLNGTVEIPLLHIKGPITTYAAAPNLKFEVWEPSPGQAIERGCNGAVAWETRPGQAARVYAGKERSTAILDAVFNIELHWQELFDKAETLAIRSVTYLAVGDQPETKRPCYELKMTPKDPDGEPETWYIDTENFQRIGTVGTVMSPTGPVKRQRLFADYRLVNDVLVPFIVCEQVDIQTQFIYYKSIQQNVRMSTRRFELPEAVKKLIAEQGKSAVTTAPTTQPADAADKSTSQALPPDAAPLSAKAGGH